MKRGFLIVFVMLMLMPTVFSLSSIGFEKNLTPEYIQTGSDQSIHCLQFNTIREQIQCRLAATHLLPTQSVFCAETAESEWCQELLYDATDCHELENATIDSCYVSYANSYSVLEYDEEDTYILFLILHQINDVEESYYEGNMTITSASFLIEKLTNIGHAQMRHEPEELVSLLFTEFILSKEYFLTE